MNKGGNYTSGWEPAPGITFNDGSGDHSSNPAFTFEAGIWYNIVATYDKNYLTVYINGSFKSNSAFNQTPQTNANHLCIGSNGAYSDCFSGAIDDIRIFDHALAPSEVTKIYKLKNSKLTTAASPSSAGYMTPSPNTTVNTGDPVAVMAYPNPGYRFSKWTTTGTASATASQIGTVTLNSNSTATAFFVKDSTNQLVSLIADPIKLQDAVIQCLNQVGLTYDSTTSNINVPSSTRTQPIAVNIQNRFWSDALADILYSHGLTFQVKNSKVALYTQDQRADMTTLVMNTTVGGGVTGGGVTSPLPGLVTTNVDSAPTDFQIQAYPSKNYHFMSWSSDSIGVTITPTGPTTATASISQDSTISANFAHDTADLTMAVTDHGTTNPAGTSLVNTATAIAIIATPDNNHHFLNWTSSDPVTFAKATSASTTVTLNGGDGSAATATANFNHDQGTLTVKKNGNGTVEGGLGDLPPNDTVTDIAVTAKPDFGYHLASWTASGSAKITGAVDTASTTVQLTGDHNCKGTVTANFAINVYAVTFAPNDPSYGSITGNLNQNITHGTDCTAVSATANADYHFTGWTGDYIGNANPLTVTDVTSDMNITANFTHNQGTITMGLIGTGSVDITPASGPYDTKTDYAIVANETDPSNFKFINWTIRGEATVTSSTSANTNVRLTGQDGCNAIVTANFFPKANDISSTGTANIPLAAPRSMKIYKVTVPSGTTRLLVETTGDSGDCDLYIMPNTVPSIYEYYAKSTNIGTTESITVPNPTAADWYILVYGYPPSNYVNVNLTATLDTDLPEPATLDTVSTNQPDKVTLAWSGSATSYDVYRSNTSSFDMATLLSNTALNGYDDSTAVLGTVYHYWIVSRNINGTSVPSNSKTGYLSGSGTNTLINGVAVTGLSGAVGTTLKYEITTPAAPPQALLEIKASLGAGDCDLTVTGSSGSVYGIKITNNEIIRIENPAANEIFTVTLYANSAYSGLTLLAKFYSAKPVAPSGIAASDGTYPDAVLVSWKESAGTSTYEVWRAEKIGSTVPKSPDATIIGETSDISFMDTAAVLPKIYYYWIKAKNPAGSSAFSSGTSGYVSKVPVAPSSLTASDGTYFDKIRLTWPKVAGATSYLLYRDTGDTMPPGSFIEIEYDSTKSTYTYDDMGGADPSPNLSNLKYYYWVVAKNANGPSPAKMNTGYISTKVPASVTASKGTFFEQVKVTWTAIDGASSYNIYRSQDPLDPGSVFDTASTPVYYDSTVTDAQEYYYWVEADCNGDYQSKLSKYSLGYAQLVAPSTKLSAPVMKSASYGTYADKVVLDWGDVPLAATYNIYRKINTSDLWGAAIGNVPELTYEDPTAVARQKYLYAVTAVNGTVESIQSNVMIGLIDDGSTTVAINKTPIPGLSALKGEEKLYQITVPANCALFVVKAENLNVGDSCDIYAKLSPSFPTTTSYNAKGTLIPGSKTDKSLTVVNPVEGTWYILIVGSGKTGYTNADLTVSYHFATDIVLTDVPADDLAVPFTAAFKGILKDEDGSGIPGFNIGVRDPVTGLKTWLTTKTDANGSFTYSAKISGEGEYTYDFFLTKIPDSTRTIASWTVRTKRSPYNPYFDFMGYIQATPETLSTSSPADLSGMQEYISMRRGFENGPVVNAYAEMWLEKTILQAASDKKILDKLDSGLYLLLYGTESAAVGNGKDLNPALTTSPLLVHVTPEKQADILGNLKENSLIDNEFANAVTNGGIGVLAIASYYNPDETDTDFTCDVALYADEELKLLYDIAVNWQDLEVYGPLKYDVNIGVMDVIVNRDNGTRIGTRIRSFIKK